VVFFAPSREKSGVLPRLSPGPRGRRRGLSGRQAVAKTSAMFPTPANSQTPL